MPSSGKTPNIELNAWTENDIPKMSDFNLDNQKIDEAIGRSAPLIGTYTGDGEGERYIDFGFVPSFGIIFAAGKIPFQTVVADGNTKLYAVLISAHGCSQGAHIEENEVVVYNVPSPFLGRYALLNENNTTYVYIMFR